MKWEMDNHDSLRGEEIGSRKLEAGSPNVRHNNFLLPTSWSEEVGSQDTGSEEDGSQEV